jgi:DNA-binding GntR family transcriptional regulator
MNQIDALVPQYRSLTQIIVETLRQRIFEGEYEPGARLNISDLAHQFGASPVPVREALRNLETEGLVEFRLNRGVAVRTLSAAQVRELFLIRAPLELLALTEAVKTAREEDLEPLERLLKDLDDNAGTPAWHRLHTEFHNKLYILSRLPRLNQLLVSLRGQMRPFSKAYLMDPHHLARAQDEHRRMLDCLRRHDEAPVAAIIYEHLARPARMAMSVIGGESLAIDVYPS